MINVALCADENYIVPCLVTIGSIFENNKGESVTVYVLTDYFTSESCNIFESVASRYDQTIHIVKIDINTYSNLKVNNRYTKATYYRFLLPEIIKDQSKILYLDCDIIVRGSLKKLLETDLTNYSCGVIEDAQCDDTIHKNRIHFLGDYFNAGVLLINLEYWRKNNVSDELVSFIEQNPERCFYNDQDALNIVLEDKVLFLPYTYNFQEKWYSDLNALPFLFTKHDKVCQCRVDPLIVHYTLAIKPWYLECSHPLASEWIHYLECLKLDYRISHYYNLQSRIKRTIRNIIIKKRIHFHK